MVQTGRFAAQVRLAVAAGILASIAAVLLVAPGADVARGATTACPSFRVLGNDKIGRAVLPKGNYSVKVFGGFSCSKASAKFTRFLSDWDGNLPNGWEIVPNGSGKATFTKKGSRKFAVSRGGGSGGGGGGGGGGHKNPLGTNCPGTFRVLHNDRIGPLSFPKGNYSIFITPGSKLSCKNASSLFQKFLDLPNGNLPDDWRIKASTGTFYKQNHPRGRRFRVEPST